MDDPKEERGYRAWDFRAAGRAGAWPEPRRGAGAPAGQGDISARFVIRDYRRERGFPNPPPGRQFTRPEELPYPFVSSTGSSIRLPRLSPDLDRCKAPAPRRPVRRPSLSLRRTTDYNFASYEYDKG